MPDVWSKIVGIALFMMGVAYVYLGHQSEVKKSKLHGKISDRVLKRSFFEYDKDGNDTLGFTEFHQLIQDLGLDVGAQEAELLFLSADKVNDNAISLEEFKIFWNDKSEEPHSMQV
eukprot:CAMPEP_0197235880 /NCGR_PEP_ID=MMETSP1429-20130617/3198_1 /TAXON_ID=49237 /ORGANISM="Chaetoceros  sp., Strain UNC1202" /LENGTH=115 /DNA_ID=CAMNT_0042694579 /DNA_START=89 /DNA_END=436 /DNA_ORIENTATION=-